MLLLVSDVMDADSASVSASSGLLRLLECRLVVSSDDSLLELDANLTLRWLLYLLTLVALDAREVDRLVDVDSLSLCLRRCDCG